MNYCSYCDTEFISVKDHAKTVEHKDNVAIDWKEFITQTKENK